MDLNKSLLLQIYRRLCLIRFFEETVIKIHGSGELIGPAHPYIGEEAVAVGACAALRSDDRIAGNHRSHGHPIAKGGSVNGAMAELLGKSGGFCKGKGGSMHLADFSVGILGESGIVASSVPITTGAALASKLSKKDFVSLVFFGDGASNQGACHESMNMASLWKLPVIFVCENNTPGAVLKAAGGTNSSNMPAGRVLDTPAALGMEAYEVDGGDAEAVDLLFRDCINRVRANSEPIFIEALSERWPGNYYSFPSLVTGPTELAMIWDNSHIEGDYIDWFRTHDPIFRLGRVLLANGIITQDEILKIDRERISRPFVLNQNLFIIARQ